MTEGRIVVACRIFPDLKAQLENEAAERGVTLSSYLEFLITNRDFILDEPEKIDEEPYEAARQYVAELENENTLLKDEVNRLLSHVTITNKDLNEKTTEKETVPTILSEPYRKAILENLEIISQKNPNYSPEELLLASTGLALENGTFTTYNLKDFLKKFKHSYQLKNNIGV